MLQHQSPEIELSRAHYKAVAPEIPVCRDESCACDASPASQGLVRACFPFKLRENYAEVQLLAVSVRKTSKIMSKWCQQTLEDIQLSCI